MVKLPERYEPLTIGRYPYITELRFEHSLIYGFGFDGTLDALSALDIVIQVETEWNLGTDWGLVEHEYVTSLRAPRSEYRLVDRHHGRDPARPDELKAVVDADGPIRYIIPIYESDDGYPATFSLVPNHVVVSSSDLSFADMSELDTLSEPQRFYPLVYRDALIGTRSRRIYSSLITEPALVPPEFSNYRGEPGAALLLMDLINKWGERESLDLSAEPDWYISYPNDLGTPATAPDTGAYDDSIAGA